MPRYAGIPPPLVASGQTQAGTGVLQVYALKCALHFHAFMMARQMMADVGAGAEGGERVSPMPQSTRR